MPQSREIPALHLIPVNGTQVEQFQGFSPVLVTVAFNTLVKEPALQWDDTLLHPRGSVKKICIEA